MKAPKLPIHGAPKTQGVIRQFASSARLFSQDEFSRIQGAVVGVVGLGGVGSWAAEALARSGIGGIFLIDMDHVAESNINRQVQATHSVLGASKVDALSQRIADISPECRVQSLDAFLGPENAQEILDSEEISVWIDATDDLAAKKAMVLLMQSQKRLADLIVSGGAGGKLDPLKIKTLDLSETSHDALLSTLRYDLRKNHGFPRSGKMRVQVVSSAEPMRRSEDCDPQAKLACAGYGSMVTVTAAMGLAAAHLAIKRICKK